MAYVPAWPCSMHIYAVSFLTTRVPLYSRHTSFLSVSWTEPLYKISLCLECSSHTHPPFTLLTPNVIFISEFKHCFLHEVSYINMLELVKLTPLPHYWPWGHPKYIFLIALIFLFLHLYVIIWLLSALYTILSAPLW